MTVASDDIKLFICERQALSDLLEGLKTSCSCGMSSNPWALDSTIQAGFWIHKSLLLAQKIHVFFLFLEGACHSLTFSLPSVSESR